MQDLDAMDSMEKMLVQKAYQIWSAGVAAAL